MGFSLFRPGWLLQPAVLGPVLRREHRMRRYERPPDRRRKGLGHPGLRNRVSPLVHWHCVALGRVQGVNYRARVAESARSHGLVGAVANRPDGTVLIDVQGPVDAVEAFLREVSGPRGLSHARVVQRVAEVPVAPDLLGFEILRD